MKGIKLPELKLNLELPIGKQIYTFLRRLITDISIKPGTRLSENVLSKHFKVSRQPVREAIFHLKRCGLVEVYPQIGSYVTKISLVNLQQTCFLRSSIEMNSIAQALKNRDQNFQNALERMKDTLRRQRELFDDESAFVDKDATFLDLDDEFHKHICELCGVSMAWDVIWDLKANLDRIRYLSTQRISKIDNLIDQHQHIYDLIEQGEAQEAMEAVRVHLFEITQTSIPIAKENSEWFIPEELNSIASEKNSDL